MNILVCVKQVPNTRHMTIDPETNRLVRHGITSILNPADRYVLEKALRLKDQYGAAVTVVSMGAPQAADILTSAYMVGADRCLLLTDPAFGGSDTFATASVLAAAVHREQERTGAAFDLIFCGKSTIDGETGQVGPELAELLGIPNFTNISSLEYTGVSFRVAYSVDSRNLVVDVDGPLLVAYPLGGDLCLRGAVAERLERADEIVVPRLALEDLSPWLNRDEIGLNGSATRVIRSFVPETQRRSLRIDRGTPREKAAALEKALAAAGLLGGGEAVSGEAAEVHRSAKEGGGRICVFVEQDSRGGCRSVSLELLSPAVRIGERAGLRVSAILVGADNSGAIEELCGYPVDEILSCEDCALEQMQLHDYVEAVADMIVRYSPEGLLVGSTALGKELAARIAARFHTGLTAECSGVRYDEELGGIVWSRPAYGGKLMADIICRTKRPQMGTVREGVFVKPGPCVARPEVIPCPLPEAPLRSKVTFISNTAATGFAPKAANRISMVVGMGRGIRNMDGFDLCCDFADAIGADIGASRGAVELRFVSQQYLIGSNGKTIRPGIYFACGISGSLQHMTGVLDSGCIVAINKDPHAEIFQYADYGVVGDLFQILPELERQMTALLS